jgi:purine-nucleoside phosphorylase
MDTYQKIIEARDFLQPFNVHQPKVSVVLGSGLGNFVQELKVENEIPYEQIPHFLFQLLKDTREN